MFNPELAATVSSSRPLESQTRAPEVFPIYDARVRKQVRLVGYVPKLFPGFIPASTVDPGSKLYTTPYVSRSINEPLVLKISNILEFALAFSRWAQYKPQEGTTKEALAWIRFQQY
ncbi:hypothetical protein GEMRC1_002138 [Eukaryota sp. GEM-RC1]